MYTLLTVHIIRQWMIGRSIQSTARYCLFIWFYQKSMLTLNTAYTSFWILKRQAISTDNDFIFEKKIDKD